MKLDFDATCMRDEHPWPMVTFNATKSQALLSFCSSSFPMSQLSSDFTSFPDTHVYPHTNSATGQILTHLDYAVSMQVHALDSLVACAEDKVASLGSGQRKSLKTLCMQGGAIKPPVGYNIFLLGASCISQQQRLASASHGSWLLTYACAATPVWS